MKVLSNLKNIELNINENNIELNINESNKIKYNLTKSSNNEVLSDLIEHKAFATTFLFLNENYELEIEKNSFINESNVIDFYKDCEELLNENVKVVTEKGPLLVSIKGYPIYENEKGILRGVGEKKILESFEEDVSEESEELNEEGTQCSDIAPKVDQDFGKKRNIVTAKINGLKEEVSLRGFLRNDKGQYERGNYILCKENDKFLAVNKNNI